jgi:hypothetical protein
LLYPEPGANPPSRHFEKQVLMSGKMIYLGPSTSSDCPYNDPVSGFFGGGVNFPEKYRYNRLFCEKTRFNQEKTCQFSGLWLITISAPLFYQKRREKRQPDARRCPPNRSRRRMGVTEVVSQVFLIVE